jgi:hypothetical protein
VGQAVAQGECLAEVGRGGAGGQAEDGAELGGGEFGDLGAAVAAEDDAAFAAVTAVTAVAAAALKAGGGVVAVGVELGVFEEAGFGAVGLGAVVGGRFE